MTTHEEIRECLNLHPMDDDILAVVKDGLLLYIGYNIEKAYNWAKQNNASIYAHSEIDLAGLIQQEWRTLPTN